MKEQNEKYAALLTVLAILICVIYSDAKFDLWDSWLGVLGFIFAVKFYKEIIEKDKFLCLLIGALFSISIVSFTFPFILIYRQIDPRILRCFWTYLDKELIFFSVLTVILYFFIYWLKFKRKSNP